MALFTSQQLIDRVRNDLRKGGQPYGRDYEIKSKSLLAESREFQDSAAGLLKEFDIFLSHSSSDVEQVIGLKLIIEDLGFSVYVDWIDDPQLDRKKVNKDTANLLKYRMSKSKCLFYAFSENSNQSKWMPWELGYFDALKGKVAVLPIAQTTKTSFTGTEYLGLYYYIDIATFEGTDNLALWVSESSDTYIRFDRWLQSKEAKPFKHTN